MPAFNFDHPDGVSTNLTIHVTPPSVPALGSWSLRGSNFSATLPRANGSYVFERTFDLTPPVVWAPVGYFYFVADTLRFIDLAATNDAAYYRVRLR